MHNVLATDGVSGQGWGLVTASQSPGVLYTLPTGGTQGVVELSALQ